MASRIFFHISELINAHELYLSATPAIKRELSTQLLEWGRPFNGLEVRWLRPTLKLIEHKPGAVEIPKEDPILLDDLKNPINLHPFTLIAAERHIFELGALIKMADWHHSRALCPLCRKEIVNLSLVFPDESTFSSAKMTNDLFRSALVFKKNINETPSTLEIAYERKEFLELCEEKNMIDSLQLIQSPLARFSLRAMSVFEQSARTAPHLTFIFTTFGVASGLIVINMMTGQMEVIPVDLKIFVLVHGLLGFFVFHIMSSMLDRLFSVV